MNLTDYLTTQFFAYFLVFCRVGGVFMLLPGFGDAYVAARIRLMLALIISLALTPAIPHLPGLPVSPITTLVIIFHEIVIGVLIGGIIKLLTSCLNIAGTIIAAQSSLGQASLFDPTQQTQGAVFGTFMEMLGIVLMFSLNLHHFIIAGIVDSYSFFAVNSPLNYGDFSELATKAVAHSFAVGMQIAAPLIVIGILVNLTSGILARLMPAFQVFFVIMPAQILVSFFVFMVTLSTGMMIYMQFLSDSLSAIFPTK